MTGDLIAAPAIQGRRSVFPPASRLQRDIVRTILYFDQFDHPLTVEEIYRFLPSNSTSVKEIQVACSSSPLSSLLSREGGYYFSAGARSGLCHERSVKERRARRFWLVARLMGTIMSRFPYVRGVFVSGELSKGVVGPSGDIDFLVVTAEKRLWITRTLLILFKKVFLLNSKKFFCLNHFVTESHLKVEEHNIYVATEIATLKPVVNPELLRRYWLSNVWIREYFPNFFPSQSSQPKRRNRRFLQRIFESPLSGAFGDRLDTLLLSFWKRIWKRRYAHLPEARRNELFRSEASVSTAYGGDFLHHILSGYSHRLKVHGLDDHD